MNFSYNKIQCPIPQGTKIQSQNILHSQYGLPLENWRRRRNKQQNNINEEKEEKYQIFSWKAAAKRFVPGVVFGLTIVHIFTSYK